jgi:hypothetical protein
MRNSQVPSSRQAHRATSAPTATYRAWTEAFTPGSHYVGNWNQGSKILFLGPDPASGKLGGMISRIKESRPYEFISIEHLGVVQDGKEDTASEAAKAWAGALENYLFKEQESATELSVDLEIDEEFQEMFENTWPKALQKVKELAEKNKQIEDSIAVSVRRSKATSDDSPSDCRNSIEHNRGKQQ